MCYFINGKNYIYPTRDEMIRQISSMRGRFQSYKDYAGATFEESFTKKEIADAYVVKSECFESSYFENKGAGIFVRTKLPVEAQFAPVFGMITGDYNDDGNLDVLLAGNSYATEASTGRYDALTGLLLAGDGKGHFKPLASAATGFTADADAKGMAQLKGQNGSNIILLGNNASTMEAYQLDKKSTRIIAVKNDDLYAIVHKKNGQVYKQEFYWGSNYLSQSSRILQVGKDVISVSVYDGVGNKREEAIKN